MRYDLRGEKVKDSVNDVTRPTVRVLCWNTVTRSLWRPDFITNRLAALGNVHHQA